MSTTYGRAFAVFSLAAAAAPAGPNTADTAAIRTFLTRVYSSYRECIGAQTRCPASVPWSSIFTVETKRLIDRDSPQGEATVANDADPICGCQDNGTYHVSNITLAAQSGGRVRARVAWAEQFHGARTDQRHRTLILQKTAAGWRVYDVLEDNGDSYRQAIINELRTNPRG